MHSSQRIACLPLANCTAPNSCSKRASGSPRPGRLQSRARFPPKGAAEAAARRRRRRVSASVIGWLCFPVAASVGAADNKAGMCACSYVHGTGMCRMSCPIQMPLAMCSRFAARLHALFTCPSLVMATDTQIALKRLRLFTVRV